MARGDSRKRKIRAHTSKANHGRKPNKGRRKTFLRFKEIFKSDKREGKSIQPLPR